MGKFAAGDRVIWSHRMAGQHGDGSVIKAAACQAERLPSVSIVDENPILGEMELSAPRFGSIVGESAQPGCFEVKFDAGYSLDLHPDELVKIGE